MRLAFSTSDFVYAGRPRRGLPIILDDEMRPAQPFQDFLLWKLLGQGKYLSPLTFKTYGERLWDFAMFLGANNLQWDEEVIAVGTSVVTKYRDWSLGEQALARRTINGRLRLVREFYEWALAGRLIAKLPFAYSETRAPNRDHMLKHLDEPGRRIAKSNLEVREWLSMPEFLTIEQLRITRSALRSSGHRLLFDLMTRVGLRSVEARTFPTKYVFDPSKRTDCQPDRMIRIRLHPSDMSIKFDKPRDVDMPYSLMQDLHAYTLYERNRLLGARADEVRELIATVNGTVFSKDAVGQLFRAVSAKTSFRATALMLRHSYAVHTLRRLRAQKDFVGEPLLYVRDRLGHEDVQTTVVYLRQIDQLAGGLMLAMHDEFDRLFESTQ